MTKMYGKWNYTTYMCVSVKRSMPPDNSHIRDPSCCKSCFNCFVLFRTEKLEEVLLYIKTQISEEELTPLQPLIFNPKRIKRIKLVSY